MVSTHFDMNVGFPSREDALKETRARAAYHPTRLYQRTLDNSWTEIYNSEKEKTEPPNET